MKTLILNIGLATDATAEIAAIVVEQMLFANAFTLVNRAVRQSDTEPTLVAAVQWYGDGIGFQRAMWNLCVDLRQEAIAVWSPDIEKGALFGPKAADWGPFDHNKFVLMDGSRLSQHFNAVKQEA